MENNTVVISSANHFVDKVQSLRQQKGRYIELSFCQKLKDTSFLVTTFLQQSLGSKEASKFTKRSDFPHLEKISDDMVDLCLESIIYALQKASCKNPDKESCQIFQEVIQDLQYLARCVNLTFECADNKANQINVRV